MGATLPGAWVLWVGMEASVEKTLEGAVESVVEAGSGCRVGGYTEEQWLDRGLLGIVE